MSKLDGKSRKNVDRLASQKSKLSTLFILATRSVSWRLQCVQASKRRNWSYYDVANEWTRAREGLSTSGRLTLPRYPTTARALVGEVLVANLPCARAVSVLFCMYALFCPVLQSIYFSFCFNELKLKFYSRIVKVYSLSSTWMQQTHHSYIGAPS